MTTRILTEAAASISELKANPMKVALSAHGEAIAVLNRNEPAFYCIPADTYEFMMDHMEDLELLAIAEQRKNEASIKVSLNEL
ncbi:type II toxin-antitoxin system Phd/YefM family antitoxin [Psychrosphaera sp. 1_MG-2023]|uniref:Antitoxin n=2 Tax=Alteromonadales TaxID=135622 RepID=A0ABT5FBQ5_9GAMM|nr:MULTISPECIES: type II toxin-antitoxin system Phd/YefM family antitoxin [Alteromonadales]MDC2888002.1 type II toxin-antitoxin system Phd/YefM family antitoxin [Psychrosphaera sp. G1-22]MDC2888978.1 type II toxin-antitoxin system Phd/YefM family antitoxin [Psychrosphaera sp. G1-22]MDO6721597.1 type II toxin-antitoxin system Phd/YefM family antitoxin [Psychrosphaera sp. 1_MG-2023]TYK64158.1 type II toxin-antitoxin system Phd/YefM family antitoxin [Colwellia echini]